MGTMFEYTRPDGASAPGYLALPPDQRPDAPGIVVIQEWWGLTDQIKTTADDIAAHGYRALVPDLYRGRTAALGDEANHLMEGLDFSDAGSQDVRGAVEFLKKDGGKCAVLGFCMGGVVALISSIYNPQIDAAVAFYGFPPPEAGDPGKIAAWVLCHAALRDTFFTPERVQTLEQKLQAGGVNYELHWYDAEHGFCNPNPPGQAGLGHYNEAAAVLAWERTYAFLERVL
jgi:carboxymethylenebutenolidase